MEFIELNTSEQIKIIIILKQICSDDFVPCYIFEHNLLTKNKIHRRYDHNNDSSHQQLGPITPSKETKISLINIQNIPNSEYILYQIKEQFIIGNDNKNILFYCKIQQSIFKFLIRSKKKQKNVNKYSYFKKY